MTTPTLHGKTALVTGAAGRIGASIVRALHAQGMRVAVHYRRSAAAAESLAAQLNAVRKDSAVTLAADLLASEDLEALIENAVARLGGLDVLVNNASSYYATPLDEITEAAWHDLLGTNLKAPLFLAKAAAPHLRAARGCIVNLVDIYAERPLDGHALYCAAKGGLAVVTRALAREMGPEVRVNAVAPGAILWPVPEPDAATKQAIIDSAPLKRRGDPDEVARAVLYLVKDADYTTGETIAVDGGRRLCV